jgi:hypothetical protein
MAEPGDPVFRWIAYYAHRFAVFFDPTPLGGTGGDCLNITATPSPLPPEIQTSARFTLPPEFVTSPRNHLDRRLLTTKPHNILVDGPGCPVAA